MAYLLFKLYKGDIDSRHLEKVVNTFLNENSFADVRVRSQSSYLITMKSEIIDLGKISPSKLVMKITNPTKLSIQFIQNLQDTFHLKVHLSKINGNFPFKLRYNLVDGHKLTLEELTEN